MLRKDRASLSVMDVISLIDENRRQEIAIVSQAFLSNPFFKELRAAGVTHPCAILLSKELCEQGLEGESGPRHHPLEWI